jgi:hypothetical protein
MLDSQPRHFTVFVKQLEHQHRSKEVPLWT